MKQNQIPTPNGVGQYLIWKLNYKLINLAIIMVFVSKNIFNFRQSKPGASPELKTKITVKMPNIKVYNKNKNRDLVDTQVLSKWDYLLKKYKEMNSNLRQLHLNQMKIM